MADKEREAKEQEVIAALASEKYDFRTVAGISAETNLAESEVREILTGLEKDARVRRSLATDSEGRDLYTSKKRGAREVLTTLRRWLAKE